MLEPGKFVFTIEASPVAVRVWSLKPIGTSRNELPRYWSETCRCWYATKPKSLSFRIGPPSVPPAT